MDVYQQLAYEAVRWTVGPVVGAAIRLRSEGTGNVPPEGGALIVANHRNPFFDPLAMIVKVPRPIEFMAASVFFTIPVMRQVARGLGALPVHLEGGARSEKDIEEAVLALRDGELVGIFPEGVSTIANPRKVHKVRTFRTGFVRIALTAQVPVIPVALVSRGERTLVHFPAAIVKPYFDHPEFADGAEIGYYKRLTIRIGRPLDLSGYYGLESDARVAHHLSGIVRRVISKLYNGDDLDRFLTGEKEFDVTCDRV